MYTISETKEVEIEIKKSRFIAKLYKVYKVEEVNQILESLREEHPDATHVCYAYKLENVRKFSDDGEPGGTAGLPMMEVLNKNELDYVLAVVIRYFGGIKLGSGGLVRAYSSTMAECLKKTTLKELVPGYKIEVYSTYEKAKRLEYLLKGYSDIEKEYLEQVKFTIPIEQENIYILEEYNPKILEEIWIEKDSKTR